MAAATLASLHGSTDPERCLRELDARGHRVRRTVRGRGPALLLVRVRGRRPARARRRRPPRRATPRAAQRDRLALPLAAVAGGGRTGPRSCSPAGEPEAAARRSRRRPPTAPSGVARRSTPPRRGCCRAARSPRPGDAEQAKAVLQRVAADAARGGAHAAAQRRRPRAARARHPRLRPRAARQRAGASCSDARARDRRRSSPAATRTSRSRPTLYLSEKTVENALTRVYAKVGVRSRAQLARAWAAGGLDPACRCRSRGSTPRRAAWPAARG